MEKEKSMADKVAEIFSREPGEPYNVLFVYGAPSETEKFADRIGRDYTMHHPDAEIVRETGRSFHERLIQLVQAGKWYDARLYRNCELLIFEHIQDVAQREISQEVFYGILDSMLCRGRPILVTGDKPVPGLTALEDRICAQLSGGISLELKNEE